MATETTSQCHVTTTAVSRQTSGRLHLHAELPARTANRRQPLRRDAGGNSASGAACWAARFELISIF